MPELAMEISHLDEADRHIEEAALRIRQATQRILEAQAHGGESTESAALLQNMRNIQATFEAHRALIVRSIADIRAGRRTKTDAPVGPTPSKSI